MIRIFYEKTKDVGKMLYIIDTQNNTCMRLGDTQFGSVIFSVSSLVSKNSIINSVNITPEQPEIWAIFNELLKDLNKTRTNLPNKSKSLSDFSYLYNNGYLPFRQNDALNFCDQLQNKQGERNFTSITKTSWDIKIATVTCGKNEIVTFEKNGIYAPIITDFERFKLKCFDLPQIEQCKGYQDCVVCTNSYRDFCKNSELVR